MKARTGALTALSSPEHSLHQVARQTREASDDSRARAALQLRPAAGECAGRVREPADVATRPTAVRLAFSAIPGEEGVEFFVRLEHVVARNVIQRCHGTQTPAADL